MQGYVLAFRPTTGSGTIVTDAGQAFSFSGHPHAGTLQGGDVVSFEAGHPGGTAATAQDVRLVQRWYERLTVSEKPLVSRLFSTLQMPAVSRQSLA